MKPRHLKRVVLRLLSDGRPRSAREIARAVGAIPRSMCSYLRRLERYHLVRASGVRRSMIWQIGDNGRARLRWFETHPRYDFMLRRFHG